MGRWVKPSLWALHPQPLLPRLGDDADRGKPRATENPGKTPPAPPKPLTEGVHKQLHLFVPVPLCVTAQPETIVEGSEQLRFRPHALTGRYVPGSVMEVGVPKSEHVVGFVAARLSKHSILPTSAAKLTQTALRIQIPARGRVQ